MSKQSQTSETTFTKKSVGNLLDLLLNDKATAGHRGVILVLMLYVAQKVSSMENRITMLEMRLNANRAVAESTIK